jgi:hypothetical protein
MRVLRWIAEPTGTYTDRAAKSLIKDSRAGNAERAIGGIVYVEVCAGGSIMSRSLHTVLGLSLVFTALACVTGCTTTSNDAEDSPPQEPEVKAGKKGGGAKSTDGDGDQAGGGKCTPKTCEKLGVSCGTQEDGCGGTVDCGACDPSCVKKTCAVLQKSCGKHDDGCGSLVDCGACNPNCQPKTCAELQKTCGNHDDGCGGSVSCGICPTNTCAADSQEANNSPQAAKDLGPTSDSGTTKAVYSLTLPDGDEDWFKTKVSDDGFSGNPRVSASVARVVEVSVFYECDAGRTNYSFCPNAADTVDNTIGHGCRGRSNAMVASSCSGIDESGTAYIRVRKLTNDGQCGGYSLDVKVETE